MTFMPPPVEPAHPPIKLENISSTGNRPGQAEKFVVVKPVVVAIDMTWNKPFEMVCVKDAYSRL